MTIVKIDQKVDDFTLPATGEQDITLSHFMGKNIIIYFYPKDSTPGCTTEGQNFRDLFEAFAQNDCIIFGVSKDSIRKHENFKAKQSFPFELISDAEEKLCHEWRKVRVKGHVDDVLETLKNINS